MRKILILLLSVISLVGYSQTITNINKPVSKSWAQGQISDSLDAERQERDSLLNLKADEDTLPYFLDRSDTTLVITKHEMDSIVDVLNSKINDTVDYYLTLDSADSYFLKSDTTNLIDNIRAERNDTLDDYPLKTDVTAEIGDTTSDLRDLINSILYVQSRTATASDTLDLTDAYKIVRMDITTTANSITVLQNSVVAFPVGTQVTVEQVGTGQTSVVAGPGVTINSYNSALKLVGRYAGATLYKSATNTWWLFGQITN